MDASVTHSRSSGSRSFELIRDSMLQSDDLPLTEVLDCDTWQAIFDAHGIDFGSEEDAVVTPVITLWALISQAFFKGEMRGCKAAVGRIASLWATLGKVVGDTNTGAYCRARAKISWQAVCDICCQIARTAEENYDAQKLNHELSKHAVVAEAQSNSQCVRPAIEWCGLPGAMMLGGKGQSNLQKMLAQ